MYGGRQPASQPSVGFPWSLESELSVGHGPAEQREPRAGGLRLLLHGARAQDDAHLPAHRQAEVQEEDLHQPRGLFLRPHGHGQVRRRRHRTDPQGAPQRHGEHLPVHADWLLLRAERPQLRRGHEPVPRVRRGQDSPHAGVRGRSRAAARPGARLRRRAPRQRRHGRHHAHQVPPLLSNIT